VVEQFTPLESVTSPTHPIKFTLIDPFNERKGRITLDPDKISVPLTDVDLVLFFNFKKPFCPINRAFIEQYNGNYHILFRFWFLISNITLFREFNFHHIHILCFFLTQPLLLLLWLLLLLFLLLFLWAFYLEIKAMVNKTAIAMVFRPNYEQLIAEEKSSSEVIILVDCFHSSNDLTLIQHAVKSAIEELSAHKEVLSFQFIFSLTLSHLSRSLTLMFTFFLSFFSTG
jgi:hypothetical protein